MSRGRLGKKVKDKIREIEGKQRKRQSCPYCKRLGVKRLSKGVWKCGKCEKKFTADTFYLPK